MLILLLGSDISFADKVFDSALKNGWNINHVKDLIAARLALLETSYSIVLIDNDLSSKFGLNLLRNMRAQYDVTPVLITAESCKVSERITWIDSGADDYLLKPFEFDELWARVRAVTRRSEGRMVPLITWGDIEIDVVKRSVTRAGKPVRLSDHEYRILLTLMQGKGHVVGHEHLEAMMYDGAATIESNTLAVHICQVRRKLGAGIITTAYGQGYLMANPC